MAGSARAGARMHAGRTLGGRRANGGREPCGLWPGGSGMRDAGGKSASAPMPSGLTRVARA